MNIIEKRRRKAWAHATMVIMKRWNTRVTATASIDKEVMAGTVQQVMERIPNALKMLEDS